MGAVLRNPAVLAVSLGHMAVDILNSAFPVVLVALAVQYNLSNVAVGTIATLYTLSSSLSQPLFGWVTDRWDSRWVGLGGMLWLAAGYVTASFLPGLLPFVALVLAAPGSAAFHPQGALNARRAAGSYAASGTSVFFFFGQTGLAMGPMLAGLLLARFPLQATILTLVALMGPALVVMAKFAPRGGQVATVTPAAAATGDQHPIAWGTLALVAFVLVLLFRGWIPAATNTFLPKWLADEGFSAQQFGSLLGVFMFSSALGTVFGGWLADRWTRKGVVVLALLLSPLPLWLLYRQPSVGPDVVLATAAAGFLSGWPHSIMVLMGQNLFPGRMGFGSGLVLGFIFSVGAVTTWITGWMGDQIGIQAALQWLPLVAAAGALCAMALPRTRPRAAPASVPSETSLRV